jgi:hypothetical protein
VLLFSVCASAAPPAADLTLAPQPIVSSTRWRTLVVVLHAGNAAHHGGPPAPAGHDAPRGTLAAFLVPTNGTIATRPLPMLTVDNRSTVAFPSAFASPDTLFAVVPTTPGDFTLNGMMPIHTDTVAMSLGVVASYVLQGELVSLTAVPTQATSYFIATTAYAQTNYNGTLSGYVVNMSDLDASMRQPYFWPLPPLNAAGSVPSLFCAPDAAVCFFFDERDATLHALWLNATNRSVTAQVAVPMLQGAQRPQHGNMTVFDVSTGTVLSTQPA